MHLRKLGKLCGSAKLVALALCLAWNGAVASQAQIGWNGEPLLPPEAFPFPSSVTALELDSSATFQRLPRVDSLPGWVSGVERASYAPDDLAVPEIDVEPAGELYTLDELRSEMRDQVWRKGDYKIVPYGVLWGSAIYGSERAVPGPFILYIASATDEGESYFDIDTRRSRVGLNIEGPEIPMFANAKSGGQLEIDFHGVFGTVEGTAARAPENQTGLQLRHAWAEIKNENFRLMAGQTWDLVSPLNPGMLTYAVGWGGGNIGFRRMQVRYERYLHLTGTSQLELQGAMAQDIALDTINYAETADWPVLQGRVGWTYDNCRTDGGPLKLGVSGHIGEQGFDYPADYPADSGLPAQDDARIETWSLNADGRWPITSRLGVQGEFFTGENLSTYLGGIVQGVNGFTRQPIPSTGGWLDVWYDWTPRLRSHAGFGIDDPRNSAVPSRGRTKNRFVFGNVTLDVTSKLILGLEISHWKTTYAEKLPGDSLIFEFTGYYGF